MYYKTLVNLLVTSGSLGFVNYFVLTKLGSINVYSDNKEDKKWWLLCFSILNYILYSIIDKLFKYSLVGNIEDPEGILNPISFVLTMIITIFLSLKYLPKLLEKTEKVLNKKRKEKGKSESYSLTVNDAFFSKYENAQMYVYDFDNKLIFAGLGYRWSSSSENTTEFSGVFFSEDSGFEEYNELIKTIRENNYESDVLINVDKKLKFIVISEVSEEQPVVD